MSMPGVNPVSAGGYVALPISIRGCGATLSESGVNPCLSVAYTCMFLFGVTSAHSVTALPFATVGALVAGTTEICSTEDFGSRGCTNAGPQSKARMQTLSSAKDAHQAEPSSP